MLKNDFLFIWVLTGYPVLFYFCLFAPPPHTHCLWPTPPPALAPEVGVSLLLPFPYGSPTSKVQEPSLMSSAMGPFETHEAQCRWAEPGSHGPLSGLGVMEAMPHVLWSWTAQLPPHCSLCRRPSHVQTLCSALDLPPASHRPTAL